MQDAPPGAMKTLCWNCHGLGSPRTVRALKRLVKNSSPHLIFLQETLLKQHELEKVRLNLNFGGMIYVDSSGHFRSGGIALFWKTTNAISLNSCSLHHIDVTIGDPVLNLEWRFTGIYGYLDGAQKVKTWELLRSLHSHYSRPWLCAGDFNEILFNVEKKGGALPTNT